MNDRGRRIPYLLLLIAGMAIGVLIGAIYTTGFSLGDRARQWIWIALAGGFGGLLYTAREGGLTLPHRDPKSPSIYQLGWIADCAFGIAGAFVVFLLIPTEIGSESRDISGLFEMPVFDQMKITALAIVGGYGGRSLVDRAFSNLADRVEQVQKTTEQVVVQQEADSSAIELVRLHLDPELQPQDSNKLKSAIARASRRVRYEIFQLAREVRTDNWKSNPSLMARTIPCFKGLIDNSAGEVYHRNHAQLAYALKDQGGENSAENDWAGAYEQLNTAIRLRDEEGGDLRRADNSPAFLMYEFNRALCAIKLGRPVDEIVRDCAAASKRDSLRNAILTEPVFTDWAAENGLRLREENGALVVEEKSPAERSPA